MEEIASINRLALKTLGLSDNEMALWKKYTQ